MSHTTIGHDVSIQGQAAELKVAEFLLRNQVIVLNPMGNYANYDLVAEVNGHYSKLQIKSHLVTDGKTPSISLRKPVDPKEYDVIVVVLYSETGDKIYLIPSKILKGKSYISFSPKQRKKWETFLNSASVLLK
jgi:hypothetical protein